MFLNFVKMASFQFYLQLGKQNSKMRGDGSHVVVDQEFSSGKEMLRCRDATVTSFVAKVRGEVFAHFYPVTLKRHNSMQNSLFGLPGRILCEQNNPFDVKENV
jgi:hypothetical protein